MRRSIQISDERMKRKTIKEIKIGGIADCEMAPSQGNRAI